MEIRLSGHGAYHHQYHIVWIPKYLKKVLRGELKEFVEQHLHDVEGHHPDIEIRPHSIQEDHLHLVMVIPPKYSVSSIVGKIKANTSRQIRKRFSWVKEIYYRNEFWSPGFFSSTVGINEQVIRSYIEFQGKIDKGQVQLRLFLSGMSLCVKRGESIGYRKATSQWTFRLKTAKLKSVSICICSPG